MAKKKISPNPTEVPASPKRRVSTKKPAPSASAIEAVSASTPSIVSMAPAPGNGGGGNGGGWEPTQAEIAEAAYFRHLNRAGSHGDEFTDWIEAERELRQRHSS